jgi:hypothetical protein
MLAANSTRRPRSSIGSKAYQPRAFVSLDRESDSYIVPSRTRIVVSLIQRQSSVENPIPGFDVGALCNE